MFTNKLDNGRNNICGLKIAVYRKQLGNAVQRMEAGKRFVTDIELVYISRALKLSYEELLADNHL